MQHCKVISSSTQQTTSYWSLPIAESQGNIPNTAVIMQPFWHFFPNTAISIQPHQCYYTNTLIPTKATVPMQPSQQRHFSTAIPTLQCKQQLPTQDFTIIIALQSSQGNCPNASVRIQPSKCSCSSAAILTLQCKQIQLPKHSHVTAVILLQPFICNDLNTSIPMQSF